MSKALSFLTDEVLDKYKELPFEEKLLRVGDIQVAGQIMLTAIMLKKHNKITAEQHDTLIAQCVALVEAIHLPDAEYKAVFKETGAIVDSILSEETISPEARAKMN